MRRLPYPPASFDVVCSHNVLFYISDHEAGLREFRRVIRPGGQLVAALRHCTLLGNVPEDPNLQRRLERVVFSLADVLLARRLPLMLRDAGFRDINVEIETDRIYTTIGSIDRDHRRNVSELMGAAMTRIADVLGGPDPGRGIPGRPAGVPRSGRYQQLHDAVDRDGDGTGLTERPGPRPPRPPPASRPDRPRGSPGSRRSSAAVPDSTTCAGLQHIGAVRDRQRHVGVLLDHEDRRALRG